MVKSTIQEANEKRNVNTARCCGLNKLYTSKLR